MLINSIRHDQFCWTVNYSDLFNDVAYVSPNVNFQGAISFLSYLVLRGLTKYSPRLLIPPAISGLYFICSHVQPLKSLLIILILFTSKWKFRSSSLAQGWNWNSSPGLSFELLLFLHPTQKLQYQASI